MTESYISVDLETTGLNPRQDKIIEIGALRVIDGRITDRFSSFVNPGRKLEKRIVELTGIQDGELEKAPYIEEIFPAVLDFLGDLPLLGHSVLFDFSFLKKAAVDQKLGFEKSAIDTLKIARKYLANLEHRSLDYLCGYYQIAHHAHRALADAEATHYLYRKLAEQFYGAEVLSQVSDSAGGQPSGEGLFAPVSLHYRVKRDTPATKAQKEQLYRLLNLHKIEIGADVERLTRSEASRLAGEIQRGERRMFNQREDLPDAAE